MIPLNDKKKLEKNEFPAIGTLYFLKGLIKLKIFYAIKFCDFHKMEHLPGGHFSLD